MLARQRPIYYKLEMDQFPVPCTWYEAGVLLSDYRGRCLRYDETQNGYRVSTAFLVFDHNLLGDGAPVLWNTIVTKPDGNQRLYGKYATREAATQGHQNALAVLNLIG